MPIESAVQYAQLSTSNPQGLIAGNLMQLIADDIEGSATRFCADSERMRSHPIIRDMSAYRQKISSGTWGGW